MKKILLFWAFLTSSCFALENEIDNPERGKLDLTRRESQELPLPNPVFDPSTQRDPMSSPLTLDREGESHETIIQMPDTTPKQKKAVEEFSNADSEDNDIPVIPSGQRNNLKNSLDVEDDNMTDSDGEDERDTMPSRPGRHFAPPTSAMDDDDDDSPIESCWCEKKYDEGASCFWNISGGWWNGLGFSTGQAATILQVLTTLGQSHPGTFAADTMKNLLIASGVLTQSSASFHALQAYALKAAQDRAHMANRIQVVTKKLTRPQSNPKGLHLKSMTGSQALASHQVDSDNIESTSFDGCIKSYNTCTGGFWRIAGGWFNLLGFATGETAVILQFLSALQGGDTDLLIASTVISQISTVLHGLELYAYKTAAERTKKAESIKIDPEDQV